jgi:DUF4097 and DUF4098 domain-containing protein YvlB
MMKQLVAMMLALTVVACGEGDGSDHDKINGAVDVAAGQPADNASTVNGAIRVAAGATVKHASTVNGSVTLGDHATADSAEAVNGSITLGENARVTGNITTVNGSITLQKGADVAGRLENVNGHFTLQAAHVGGGIRTIRGSINVGADSRVEGGIAVEKSSGLSITFTNDVPVVIIGPGATVQGPLKFEREVKLYVSDRATIGEVTGATPVKFSGDAPPG